MDFKVPVAEPIDAPLRLALTLVASTAVLGFSMFFGGEHLTARLLLTGCFAVYFSILLHAASTSGHRPLTLTTTLFMINVLLVPAMAHCAKGRFPFFRKSYPDDLVTNAALVMLGFSVSFAIAYTLRRAPIRPPGGRPTYELSPPAVFTMILLFAGAALVGFGLNIPEFVARRGDLTELLAVRAPLQTAFFAFVRYSGFLAFLLALLAWRSGYRGFGWLIPITVGIAVLVNNPLNIPRFGLFGLLIAALMSTSRSDTVQFKASFAAIYTGALLTIFPLLSTLSRAQRGTSLIQDVSTYYSSNGDFDGFQSMINVVHWINMEGPQWGRQLAGSLFVFVPRDWWPSKAIGTGDVAAAYAGYPFTNISAPLPAEFYSDFGIFGSLVAGALVGSLVASADDFASRHRARLGRVVAVAMAAGFSAILLRGSLIGVIAPSALAILMGTALSFAQPRRVLETKHAKQQVPFT